MKTRDPGWSATSGTSSSRPAGSTALTAIPAALASGLICPTALGAPGDLDPTFGVGGRTPPLPDFDGPAWSLQPQGDDGFVFAGGEYDIFYEGYYDYYDTATGYVARVSGNGSTDTAYAQLQLDDIEVFDVAVQEDGSAVGVGRKRVQDRWQLAVFRLEPGGGLDTRFGDSGFVRFQPASADSLQGTSLVLDPDGRIVVAGTRFDQVIVVRFLQNGDVDPTFGDNGGFTLQDTISAFYGPRPLIQRTPADGYRVAVSSRAAPTSVSSCLVFGLTSSGAIDTTFGQAGVVDVASATSVDSSCGAVAMQHDGRLLVAGNEGDRAFAIRLLGSGERDAEFTATALGAELADATAIAAVDDGSVLLAGHRVGGISGALVVRLQADGLLDTLFGDGGRTSIDLPSDHGTDPVVHDIVALPDGRVMLAGGVVEVGKEQPFLARLLGSENLNAPGIVGFARDHIAVPTGGEQSVLVRRSAGTRGAVSVNYELFQPRCEGGPWDYGCGPAHYSGTLTWGDGEAGDREVLVLTTVGSALLILDEPRGGASLANRVSVLQVEGEAPVTGVVSFETSAVTVSEELNSAVQLTLRRDYVAAGAVSVTVTPVAATALADRDFSATPIVVGWGDGDFSPKTVTITLLDDRRREGVETFTVVLGYPSNGALLWGQTTATVTINDDDRSGGSGGVGGGTVGLVSALLLGLGNLLRRALGRRGRAGTQSAVT